MWSLKRINHSVTNTKRLKRIEEKLLLLLGFYYKGMFIYRKNGEERSIRKTM